MYEIVSEVPGGDALAIAYSHKEPALPDGWSELQRSTCLVVPSATYHEHLEPAAGDCMQNFSAAFRLCGKTLMVVAFAGTPGQACAGCRCGAVSARVPD